MGTSLKSSSVNTKKISPTTLVPSDVYVLLVKELREPCPPLPKPALRLTLSMRVLTSTQLSPVLVSRNSTLTCSEVVSNLLRRCSPTPSSTNPLYTKLCWWEVPPVSPRFNPWCLTSSTERNSTSPSTLMKLSPSELQYKPLS